MYSNSRIDARLTPSEIKRLMPKAIRQLAKWEAEDSEIKLSKEQKEAIIKFLPYMQEVYDLADTIREKKI